MGKFEDFDPDDIDIQDVEFNFKNLRKDGVSWFTRFLLRFWPMWGLARLARELGFNSKHMEKANDLFFDVKKVDIVPFEPGQRGFKIILDRKTALYFYQDGDHFKYDGSEVGEYEKGDVTIFDDVR